MKQVARFDDVSLRDHPKRFSFKKNFFSSNTQPLCPKESNCIRYEQNETGSAKFSLRSTLANLSQLLQKLIPSTKDNLR